MSSDASPPVGAPARPPAHAVADPLAECIAQVTRLDGRPVSPAAVAAGLARREGRLDPGGAVRAAERHGYTARVVRRPLRRISSLWLPAVLLLDGGDACVLTALDRRRQARVIFPETGPGEVEVPVRDLGERYTGFALLLRPAARADERDRAPGSGPARPGGGRLWFWRVLWRLRRYYEEALVASMLVNVLALATALFIMNVYDRVVPNAAFETLAVLAVGTLLAVGFEFLARTLRGYFLDTAGKKADLVLSGTLFEQALGLTHAARPPSAGVFASQLREVESLRDFFSSATLAAVSDLPFIAVFVWVISLIGGPLYLLPLAALPVVVAIGLVAQAPLAALMRRHMRESNLRHGLLVEAIEGAETVKTLNAEGELQGRWEDYTALTGETAVRSRLVSSVAINLTVLVQQLVTIGMVVWGVHLIGAGELTVGALIACVILAGRGLAPLAQLASLMVRYQHARHAYFSLDELMRRPVERPRERRFVHRPGIAGAYRLEEVGFAYPGSTLPALRDLDFAIEAGERVAILGRTGSGKSTLLRLLLGLYPPTEGTVLLDGADLRQYDPADVRRAAGYVSQEVRLLHGTLRENIALGTPEADDAAVIEAARLAGVEAMISRHPLGYDMVIGEGGTGLSGGQRQAVAIARVIVRDPRILLLDEPTASMDHTSEQALMARLRPWLAGRTLVLVTHKPSLLALVDRIIVLEAGRVLTDGARDEVLRALAVPARPDAAGGPPVARAVPGRR